MKTPKFTTPNGTSKMKSGSLLHLGLAFLFGIGYSLALAVEKPSNLRVSSPFLQNNTFEASWDDNSDDEDEFEFEIRLAEDEEPVFTDTALKNQTLLSTIRGGGLGATLFFRVRAKSANSGDSEWTEQAGVTFPTTSLAIDSKTFHPGIVGQAIEPYMPTTFGDATVTGFAASDLPPGFSIDETTGEITGTPTREGVFRPLVTVTDGTSTAGTFVTFRFIQEPGSPELSSPISHQDLRSNSGLTLNLDDYFSDPDTTSAVRMDTVRGVLDILLFPKTAPASVENFLNYVERGDYSDVAFHRSTIEDTSGIAVIQSGWLKPGENGEYISVPTDPGVINEPGIPNNRGTLAMAKLGGNENSGTSQTYFNVTDSPELDPPRNNGGFTVFGRATKPSLAVMDDIHSLPRDTYAITLDGTERSIGDWPTVQAPAGAVPAKEDLVTILSAAKLEQLLTYKIATAPDAAIATASIDGETLTIDSAGADSKGETALTVETTDLDGNSIETSIDIVVRQDYDSWKESQSFPGNRNLPNQDAEFDGVVNVLEYAFGGDASQDDASEILPAAARVKIDSDSRLAITFTHCRFSADLSYAVEQSEDLANWTTIWKTADGIDHANVFEVVEIGPNWILTVRDPAASPDSGPSHLRVAVTVSGG